LKYYIIAGEASGDLHGSNLIKEIVANDAQANIQCWGGDMMQSAGANVVKHIRDLAFMGFIEVLKNIKTIQKNFRFCKQDIIDFKPDVIVLIDYPGFNLRMAKWAKLLGFKIVYYISPQIWAWKENRIHDIKKYVNEMICILPFEKQFYAKWGMHVHYVGHPLVQVIDAYKQANHFIKKNEKMIALLPGSRLQEIEKKLPILLSVVNHYPDYTFVIAQSPTLQASDYAPYMLGSNIELRKNSTYQILMEANMAIVTSGTATLETALFGVPQIVCYKGNYFSYAIGKRLIKVAFISLVNLIAQKLVVAELIQNNLNTKNLILEMDKIINNTNQRNQIIADYKNIHISLGSQKASKLAADIIDKVVNQ
jgi:lipid-A-disaccharide synthase